MTNLPTKAPIVLPATYEAAKKAIAELERIDECAEWADMAKAIAAYAIMAEDSELLDKFTRIKARATRRMGELLSEVEPSKGGDRKSTGRQRPFDRKAAADAAGISERQRKTALRIARIPKAEFDRLVEADKPPTISALASRALGKRPAEPEQAHEKATDHPYAPKRLRQKAARHRSKAAAASRMAPSTVDGWRRGYINALSLGCPDLDAEFQIIVDAIHEIAGQRAAAGNGHGIGASG